MIIILYCTLVVSIGCPMGRLIIAVAFVHVSIISTYGTRGRRALIAFVAASCVNAEWRRC